MDHRKIRQVNDKKHDNFDSATGITSYILSTCRVFKVVQGGRKSSCQVLAVAGDGKGQIGIGLGKGADMPEAIEKAIDRAKRYLKSIVLLDSTISHAVIGNFGASKVILRPAAEGVGVVANQIVKLILNAVGAKNVVTKCIGSRNPHNVTKATLQALLKLRSIAYIERKRGMYYE